MSDIQPQANIERKSSKIVIIILSDLKPNSEGLPSKTKSGLVPITNLKQVHEKEKRLQKYIRSSTTVFSRTNDNNNDAQFFMSKSSIELHDAEECLRQIQNYRKNHVLLVLSGKHAENKQLIDKFSKLPQIVRIVRSISDCSQERSRIHQVDRDQPFFLKHLPKRMYTTPIEHFDTPMRLLLIEILLEQIFVNLERSGEEKQDFIKYCRTLYQNDPGRLELLQVFDTNYNKKDAIHWYTKPNSFIFRIVSKVCGSLDIDGSFRIRLILCDMYQQLKELYEKQLEQLKGNDLVVHRGVPMSRQELDGIKNTGELYMTRPFLSTSTDISVARKYYGDCKPNEEKVSVMITMKIGSKQIEDSILARINEVSANPDEEEVMLFRKMIFRIESYNEIKTESTYSVHIKMVHGEEEAEIEKSLYKKYLVLAGGGITPALGLLGLLKLTNQHSNVGGQTGQIPHSLQLSNPQMNEQLSSVTNMDNQTASVSVLCFLCHII